ncbi:histidine kinase [Treponema sp. JC4]|uniref:sensor histidine kinase n=1 Tax=Treponema sp. JC4 TaxID=1124982 RepID=UPI00025B0483|nr:ATP-binding protein [Treponema sp. JC4]EID85889.1 histidine kinase [Treponema sp. JC4]
MRRFFSFFVIFTFGLLGPAFLGAQESLLPELSDFIEKENIDIVFQTADAKKEDWIFLTASKKGQGFENLYAVNLREPAASLLILENPAGKAGVFSNLCYLAENQTLYFGIHSGAALVNGVQLFLGEGTYHLKKDADGKFSSKGLRRFSKLEPWLCQRAKAAYFDNFPEPDYAGFLNFLFGFCDFDVTPCLAYKTSDGRTLLNEDALCFLYENSLLDAIVTGEKEGYHSAFEDYLFCLDEDGRPSRIHAISANHSERFFTEGAAQVESHYFKAFGGRVFMLENIGSVKKIFDERGNFIKSEWSKDFSKLYLIYDSENDFLITQPAGYSELRLEIFETPFPARVETAPIFDFNKKLYLRDANHTDFYQLQKDFSFQKTDSPFKTSQQSPFLMYAAFIFTLIFAGALVFMKKKLRAAGGTFELEEKIRAEISSDIHDSVVQDIRAVRLDVERLKVQKESEGLQQTAVKNLTDCIKKMRDICYSLNPAEIANASLNGSKVDVISVVQALCEQFSDKTKISFLLDCEKNLTSAFLNQKEASYLARIVLEILSNIQKHSFASKFTLIIRRKNDEKQAGKILSFIIIDDGVGCEIGSLSRKNLKTHFGMRNMRLFAKAAGGKIEFLSAKDEGMQVRLSVKIEDTGI